MTACRAALGLALLLVLASYRPAEAREERTVTIGDREFVVALVTGDCFFDPEQPADKRLIDQLSEAVGADSVLLLAFGDCATIEGWRTGKPPTMRRFGYAMIAEAHLEPVFAFDQVALATAIGQALKTRGLTDYRADIGRLAKNVEQVWTTLPAGGRYELGIAYRDRFGPVQAAVVSVVRPLGPPAPRLLLYQSVVVGGKVISMVAARDYENQDTVFDTYADLTASVEATAERN